jgi:hypothetical protein
MNETRPQLEEILTPDQLLTIEKIRHIARMATSRECFLLRVKETTPIERIQAAIEWLIRYYHDLFIKAVEIFDVCNARIE